MVSSDALNMQTNSENVNIKSSHSQIKQVIGIISAKGGVGKSVITGLLACELTRGGSQVGILDADFSGSSIPHLFGLHGTAKIGQYSFLPLHSPSGIKVISPYLILEDENKLVFWKESLAGNVIKELWKEVEWGSLDYLLVDMPPATSEVAIAIMQSLPFSAMIIITTPQVLSARLNGKAISVLQNFNLPILGIIENMSYSFSADTGVKQYIFGQSHADLLAIQAKAPILTKIPLEPRISELSDLGKIEDVILNESLEFQRSFSESISALEKKRASLRLGKEEVINPITASAPAHVVRQGFSDTVIDLIHRKENVGVLDHPDAQGFFLGKCGDRMQIDLGIESGRIAEARFLADGCGATYACGSMITKMACSKTLDQAEKITSEDLLATLDGLPDDHLHCAELAVMTLRDAIIDAIEGHRAIRKGYRNDSSPEAKMS